MDEKRNIVIVGTLNHRRLFCHCHSEHSNTLQVAASLAVRQHTTSHAIQSSTQLYTLLLFSKLDHLLLGALLEKPVVY